MTSGEVVLFVVSDEVLEDTIRRLKEREADAQRKRVHFASQLAVRRDRLAQLEEQMKSQFGVSTQEEAAAKLAELRGELESALMVTEKALGEVGSSG